MTARKILLNKIKEELKHHGASAGEINTELSRLERASIEGLHYYLTGLKEAQP